MAENEYVAKNYKNQIYEHEKISSSSYGNVAIPHPLNNEAKSSVIALAISPEPISWGFNKVNLVFMLSLKEEDKELFSDIFEFITKIIKDPQTFGRIMKASTFNDFINILVSLY